VRYNWCQGPAVEKLCSRPSPYLPELEPMDYFLLPTTEDIQNMSELKIVMAAEFNRGIQKLYDHVNRCTELGGMYVVG
jgi:hypothetical protein